MKRFLIVLTLLCLVFNSFNLSAQAKKMVLFEHFTNASCAPCAQQNPIFDNNILAHNKGRILHIAYHTNWPGADPMNAHNPAEVQSRVSYYGVSGVPHIKMQGNKFGGSPSGVTNSMIDNEAMLPSPIRIKVNEMYNDTFTRDVQVIVYVLEDLPVSSYKLRTAVVEKEKTYVTAPGSNGEKYFPNIFRKFLNDATGEAFNATSAGDSVVYNFSYTLNTTVWDTAQIYVIAFVQNEGTKNVLNAASNLDPNWEVVPFGNIYQPGLTGNVSNFNINLFNFSAAQDSFMVVINAHQPTDWTAFFEYNTQSYTDTAYIICPAETNLNLMLNVTPGASSGFGNYLISISSLSDTSLAPQVLSFFVSHNITDVIVNSDGGWGAGGTTTAQDYEQNYIDGLTFAGNTSFASVNLQPFLTAAKLGLLDSIDCIFYNASWTFPSLTDASVAIFKPFLDGGGKMFVSGQDIGWETYESTSGTGQTKLFYSNYMGATYVNDGNQLNNTLTPYANEPIFGTVTPSAIVDVYSGHIYPDVISAKPFSFPVFYYTSDSTKVACVRSNSSVFKTVYLAVSLEMIANANTRKEIIKLSHDWFKGLISSTEFEASTVQLMLNQNYPNPAKETTTISFNNLNNDATLEIYNSYGKLVNTYALTAGTQQFTLPTNFYPAGIYFYGLKINGNNHNNLKKMIVIK